MDLGERIRIVLVGPMYSGNIGSVARAMKNFGFADLALVAPMARIDDVDRMYAVRAQEILDAARVVDTIVEAIDDIDLVVGTTARSSKRPSNLLRNSCSSREVAGIINKAHSRTAFLFGREDIGLKNEELELCDIVLRIPSSHAYPTLNVGTATAIVLYELFMASGPSFSPRASAEAISMVVGEADLLLGEAGFPIFRRKRAIRAIRNLMGRGLPSPREASLLLGVFRKTRIRLERGEWDGPIRGARRRPYPRGRN